MENFENRINLTFPLEFLSNEICKKYDLGDFVCNKLIEIGYEDYNYVLTTNKGVFVVKVFSTERTDNNSLELAQRADIAYKNGVSCPQIMKSSLGEVLSILTIDNTVFRILVMEYIDGNNFFVLKQLPSENELEIIATELAKLNNIEYKPNFIYDKWAIVNYAQEYKKHINLINDSDKRHLDIALKLYNSCDFSKLKYGFVHGDIIETNIIKDKNGKLFFIDFSVSNYLPRIVDIAVTICDLCLDLNNLDKSKARATKFIEAYEKISPLSDYEKDCLKKFIVCHQAITVLETTREKILENNNTDENEIFMQKGKKGLKIVLNDKNIKNLIH